ncbi:MAG: phenylacetic acid degradation operon negative regulatory protein PaaX [Gammaproteobacteria bacterium]|nr:phenylacetic acid degradation operon negative regulatory protein PaaX [Gammaproteobacteria bacterium]
MSDPVVIKRLASEFARRKPMRTTSLIVTVFGDVVSQHGGTLWLGSLVRALAPMGINERLVRTSVFRLVREGWLEFERVGRRSYYRFSDYGSHEYHRAAVHIYALDGEPWYGRWQLLIPLAVPEEIRERFRRSLHWQGFRMISAGTYAKPGSVDTDLQETLDEFDLADKVILLEADTLPGTSTELVREMVAASWQLDAVAVHYREFLARFKPLAKWLGKNSAPGPESAFVARTLLIHDYRRVILQDTRMPLPLLPSRWPGSEAERLTAQVYRALAPASVDFITAELEGDAGPMQAQDPSFAQRFGNH